MGKEIIPPESLIIGQLLAPWGIRGEMKVEVLTDFPQRFNPHNIVYLNERPFEIESCHYHKRQLILKLASVDNVNAAEQLRGQYLTIPNSELQQLPEGQYYTFQLTGLKVVTTQGETLGHIKEVLSTPCNDVYVVKGEQREILIPAIEDVVKSVDLKKGKMVIEAIKGLLS